MPFIPPENPVMWLILENNMELFCQIKVVHVGFQKLDLLFDWCNSISINRVQMTWRDL